MAMDDVEPQRTPSSEMRNALGPLMTLSCLVLGLFLGCEKSAPADACYSLGNASCSCYQDQSYGHGLTEGEVEVKDCSAATFEHDLPLACTTRPNGGGTQCACNVIGCTINDQNACTCSNRSSGAITEEFVDSCPADAGSLCCQRGDEKCFCIPEGKTKGYSCGSGEQQVSECGRFSVQRPEGSFDSCASAFAGTSTGTSPDSGSSGDSGGQTKCTPKAGVTCTVSGDCACNQACLATSTCSTCSQYCVYPCDTDADCVALSKGLSVQYTSCRTQGNIKICQ
jgi:hypothetical protein